MSPERYRWNNLTECWEFHEPAWGGWCVLRSEPADTSRPMTFVEGFKHFILHSLAYGRQSYTGWFHERLAQVSIEYVSSTEKGNE